MAPGPVTPERFPTDARRVGRSGARWAVREQLAPAAVLVAGTVGLLTLGIATGRDNWPVYAVVVLGGAAVVIRVHVRVGLSTPTIWGLVAFAVGHLAGGMVPV